MTYSYKVFACYFWDIFKAQRGTDPWSLLSFDKVATRHSGECRNPGGAADKLNTVTAAYSLFLIRLIMYSKTRFGKLKNQ
jgi:hypothetical protein